MRLILTLVLILSIITHGYSDPKKPKKPTKCTVYSCNDWDWQNKKGLFDPHSIQWPLHYTGEIFKDKVDGGHYDIDVIFNHYGKKTRVPLKDYRNSTYHPDPWFLDKGLKMNDAFTCNYWVEDRPYWKDNSCSMIAHTHEDKQINFDGPSCSKIIREWTIIDWCKWEPNGINNTKNERYTLVKDLVSHKVYFSYGGKQHDIEHDGWYSFQQVIKILDKDPPKIWNCGDIEFDLEGECAAKVKLKNRAKDTGPCPGEKLTVELKVYRTDGFVVIEKWLNAWHDKDFEVNLGYMPAGDYLIHWSVRDGCGNEGTCTQKLKVIDKNPPHLICIQDLSTSINSDDGVTIWAKDFVHKVEGPCYDNNITYSFYKDSLVTSLTFNCPDGLGINELEVFVKAGNGVYASCNTTLFVADHAQCDPDAMQIAGKVTDRFMRPITGAEVMVTAEQEYINSGMSNQNGIYGVNGISFDLGRPEIAATVHDEAAKGLDAVDLIYLLRHVLDIEKLEKTDQRAAADVNSDGVIDMEDYWDLTDIIYDVPGREANIKTWKFYDELIRFAGISNAERLVRPVKLARYRHRYDLIGIKTGDINFSWTQEAVAENRSAGRSSDYNVRALEGLQTTNVSIPNGGDIYSIVLNSADINKALITSVSAGSADLTFTVEEIEGKRSLIILSTVDLSGMTVEINTTESISLDESGLLFSTQSIDNGRTIPWNLNEVISTHGDMIVSPNPFGEFFMLSLDSDTNDKLGIEIFDATGKLMSTEEWNIDRGANQISINTDLFRSGLYIVKAASSSKQFVHRIIKK